MNDARHLEGVRSGAGGTELYWQGWLPDGEPRGVVVVAHGLGEHSGRYGNVVSALVPRGYAVYAIDHRGHGRSAGRRCYVRRFSDVVEDFEAFRADSARRHDGVPVFVLGHSFGGAVALAHAISYGHRLDGLVLSGPASASGARTSLFTVAGLRVIATFAPTLPVVQLDAGLVSRDPAVIDGYLGDPLVHHGRVPARTVAEIRSHGRRFPREAQRLRLPLLVLHGSDDGLVPAEASRLLAQRAGSADLVLRVYPGAFHEIFNEPEHPQVLADVAAWLDART